MPTSHTLTGDLSDLVGTDFPPRSVWVTIRTNLGDADVRDATGKKVRLPYHRFALASDGTFSKSLWSTAALTNPTGYQYQVEVEYPAGPGGTAKKTWASGWFSFTSDIDLAELAYDPLIPPSYYPELLLARDQAQAAATDAQTAQTAAETAQAGAEAAQAAAEAVPTTTDGLMTTVDGNSSSAFRTQQDARNAGLYAAKSVQTTVETGRLSESGLMASFVAFVDYGTNVLATRPLPAGEGLVVWRGDTGAGLPVNAEDQDIIAITVDNIAPTAPTLTAAMSGSNVALSWTGATDNVGVTKYKVYRDTVSGFTPSGANLLATVTGATTYSDTSPVSGPSYYKVTALDAEDNESAASNQAAPFNPFGIGITWHTAAWAENDPAADGATLATVADQSGNARDFTTAGSPVFEHTASGLNNHKAYRLDGVDDVLTTAAAFTALTLPYTMVIVAKRTRLATGAKAAIGGITSTPSSASAVQWSTTNYIYNLNAGVDLSPNRTDDLAIMIAEPNGTTSVFEVNGYSASGSAGGTGQPVKWIVGNKHGVSWFSQLDVAFVGFTAGTITANQKRALRDGAASFYGHTINPAA